jgi:hypothetical protein
LGWLPWRGPAWLPTLLLSLSSWAGLVPSRPSRSPSARGPPGTFPLARPSQLLPRPRSPPAPCAPGPPSNRAPTSPTIRAHQLPQQLHPRRPSPRKNGLLSLPCSTQKLLSRSTPRRENRIADLELARSSSAPVEVNPPSPFPFPSSSLRCTSWRSSRSAARPWRLARLARSAARPWQPARPARSAAHPWRSTCPWRAAWPSVPAARRALRRGVPQPSARPRLGLGPSPRSVRCAAAWRLAPARGTAWHGCGLVRAPPSPRGNPRPGAVRPSDERATPPYPSAPYLLRAPRGPAMARGPSGSGARGPLALPRHGLAWHTRGLPARVPCSLAWPGSWPWRTVGPDAAVRGAYSATARGGPRRIPAPARRGVARCQRPWRGVARD